MEKLEEKKDQQATVSTEVKQDLASTDTPLTEESQEEQADWDDFEEITKGDFKRLLGCG